LTEACYQASPCSSSNFVRFTYDKNSNVTERETPSDTTTFAWVDGRLTTATTGLDVTAFTYDHAGRLTSVDAPGSADDVVQTWRLDGLLATRTIDSDTWTYLYDGDGVRVAVEGPGGDQ